MAPERLAGPLLAVKHTVPPVRTGAVVRPRLEQQLREAGTRLTLVAAPAGWGKTSLLSRWAADPGPDTGVAWVSLDEGDDEPVRFWRYVLTALRSVGGVGPAALEAVVAPGTDPVELALPMLLNELAASSGRYVLVLDDYHLLTDTRIHEGVEYLLSYLPPALRLIVAGRADPALPLARLRARGELTELRADDLRFSPAEAADLVGAVSGRTPVDGDAAAAWRRTEGWAAGLQLVGLALRRDAGATAGDRHVLDYLASEVLPSLDPAQRELLVATAPLERLSGALCDAALDTTGSARILEDLEHAELFVTALDTDREWYRCHPLLRDALRRSAPANAGEVVARAARWYAGQGRLDEAVSHHLLAGEPEAAAKLLQDGSTWFLDNGLATTFVRLGEQLPEEQVSPQLALTLAYAVRPRGDRRIAYWLDLAERRTTPDDVVFGWHDPRAATLTMRAVVGTPESTPGVALELAERAIELERATGIEPTPLPLSALASAYAMDGRFETAAPMLQDSWRQRDTAGWPMGLSLQIGGVLGLTLLELDRDDEIERLLRQGVPLADAVERDWGAAAIPVVAGLRIVQGRHAYRRGDNQRARELLAAAVTSAETDGRQVIVIPALVFLADAEFACGNDAAARAALARAREFVSDNEPVLPVAVAWLERAEQRIGRSAVRTANRAGRLIEPLTDRELSILRILPGSASQREIAAALFLSINTVKAYTKSLYRKLGVGSRAEAVTAARALGLI